MHEIICVSKEWELSLDLSPWWYTWLIYFDILDILWLQNAAKLVLNILSVFHRASNWGVFPETLLSGCRLLQGTNDSVCKARRLVHKACPHPPMIGIRMKTETVARKWCWLQIEQWYGDKGTFMYICMLIQLCPTVCDTRDCSSPGSSVHGILLARILECVAISSSRDLFNPGIEPASPALSGGFFTTEQPRKPIVAIRWVQNMSAWVQKIGASNSFSLLQCVWQWK